MKVGKKLSIMMLLKHLPDESILRQSIDYISLFLKKTYF